MSKKVVLTGGTGFLGSYLCRALVQRGFSVHAYRRDTSDMSRVSDFSDQVVWHELPDDLEAPFQSGPAPDAVIHCAALYGRGAETAAEMIETNTLLPVALYELAAKHGVPKFINTGTVLPPELDRYALSKHQTTAWLKRIAGPTRVLNLNVQHMYGPGANRGNFVSSVMQQCLVGGPEIELTDGRQRRDFIFVDDVVAAYLQILENLPPSGGNAESFASIDVGAGEAIEVRRLVEMILRLTDSRSQLRFGTVAHRPGEPMLTVANTSHLRALGWQPRVTLEDGLKRTLAAMLQGKGNS